MEAVSTILEQYTLLRIHSIEYIYGEGEDSDIEEPLLCNEHFEWIRFSERRKSSQSQLYDGSPQVFCPYRQKAPELTKILNGTPLRLPRISYCWGRKVSIMLTNDLMDGLSLSPRLGIVKTDATIMDATKSKREGYTALSFHKKFTLEHVVNRILVLPEAQRGILPISYGEHDIILLIHKNLIGQWKSIGVTDIKYDTEDIEIELNELLVKQKYCAAAGQLYYENIESYQNGEGALL